MLRTTLGSNYSTGGILQTTLGTNYSTGGILKTTLGTNYSTGGMLQTTLGTNYSTSTYFINTLKMMLRLDFPEHNVHYVMSGVVKTGCSSWIFINTMYSLNVSKHDLQVGCF